MYASRIIKGRHQKLSLVQPAKYSYRQNCSDYATTSLRNQSLHDCCSIRRYISNILGSQGGCNSSYTASQARFSVGLNNIQRRTYSSEGDGRNASENSHKPLNDFDKGDKGKIRLDDKAKEDVRNGDAHAQLGEQEQKEWLHTEKLSIESKKKESPFLTRREKFKSEFLRRIVPWEKINLSWETFPYYIQ